jgi:CBS-domain-containing membrane protein
LTPTAAHTRQARTADGTGLTASDAMHAPGPHVDDHMTVDVALSVLISARVPHLLLQDEDGRCTGLVTRAQLAAHRGRGSWYSDRTRLRDIPLDRGPFTSSVAVLSEAEAAMRVRTLDVSPVIDEHGYALGVLARIR